MFPGHVGRLGLKVHVARLRSAMTPRSEALSHRGKSLGTRLGLRVMALQEKAKPTNSCYPAVGIAIVLEILHVSPFTQKFVCTV